ncbi:hypothetical protein DPMN_045817 [Dreissena polymorpha]|uniref:Uncharacterized protein n=1 Tax=Dreissena polymorpha TaxID=45954 RepID=A0A9D4D5P9_DREPO|nr:hypothetical protein DPMN_045817 [Dreissena polymorpha]
MPRNRFVSGHMAVEYDSVDASEILTQEKFSVPQVVKTETTRMYKGEAQSETTDMEVSVASAKRKEEEVDGFTPLPHKREVSGNLPVVDVSEMFTQDSIYDGIIENK